MLNDLKSRVLFEARKEGFCFPNEKAKAFIALCSTPNCHFVKAIGTSWPSTS